MKEGYWINARTGEKWRVGEHATFAKSEDGANQMGLPAKVREEIAPLNLDYNGPDREKIIVAVCKAGFIRMRGHGSAWAFEFWGGGSHAMWSIYQFASEWAGPLTGLLLNNLKTNEQWRGNFQEFLQIIKTDGPDGLMRVAKTLPKLSRQNWESRLLQR